ncbi:MAG TPA: glycosyl transferase [Spirochaetaceae bacterium]|nr:glycosyl transferase [Spirochaetaceae bacterium]HAW84993.1 glycosyl transferase [Spirochaetaceae bacterium]HAX37374.1 glycosyl transferase [Spirochaetaceae bacterium]HBO40300.1 glycosyl transferase [Spirochaetaceae bacterium]HCQ87749.1 glycosyl transferase [Spirochaetaceae bacterium]
MNYGWFDSEASEFVITTPRTPAPWINYVGTLSFGGFVDQTGGVLLCKGDPALNRITHYPPNATKGAFKGETLYLRIHDRSGAMSLACPYSVPSMMALDEYQCRVGPGYSRFVSRFGGLRFEALVFVPKDGQVLIRATSVRNESNRCLRIDAVPVVAYSHFDASKHLTNADWVPQTMMSEVLLPTVRSVTGMKHSGSEPGVLWQFPFVRSNGPVNFYSSSVPFDSFETRRDQFLGDGGYGSWEKPFALLADSLPNGLARRGDNIGALLLRSSWLEPGMCFNFSTFLGQAETREAGLGLLRQYRQPGAEKAAVAELIHDDSRRRGYFSIKAPDKDFENLINVLAPRQCRVTRIWSRYLSIYQTGYGSRGIGFRDSCQDLLAYMAQDSVDAAEFLILLLSFQRSDGSAWHQFNPLSLEASSGDAAEMPDRPQYYGDDHLWAVIAACAYLRETGDLALLERIVPYRDQADALTGSGSVAQHLERALLFSEKQVGRHGLPLAGFADWNDTINLAGGAESCFCACLYGYAVLELAAAYQAAGQAESATELRLRHEHMKRLFSDAAWDGRWYAAYFTVDGVALGSHGTDGKIFSYAQSWPVIAAFSGQERGRMAMSELRRLLSTPRGIKLMWPSYQAYDPDVGGVSTYPPGAKENGGIFLHTNPWAVMAECLLGDADIAMTYFTRINPLTYLADIERYEAEPYVFSQNVLGDEHPQFGLARNSWLTGTASWAYIAALDYLLGLRAQHGGLSIAPCLPSTWLGYEADRVFRGTRLRISVRRSAWDKPGLRVDGVEQPSSLIPVSSMQGKSVVEVLLTLRSDAMSLSINRGGKNGQHYAEVRL